MSHPLISASVMASIIGSLSPLVAAIRVYASSPDSAAAAAVAASRDALVARLSNAGMPQGKARTEVDRLLREALRRCGVTTGWTFDRLTLVHLN